jgi:hypothetical protein
VAVAGRESAWPRCARARRSPRARRGACLPRSRRVGRGLSRSGAQEKMYDPRRDLAASIVERDRDSLRVDRRALPSDARQAPTTRTPSAQDRIGEAAPPSQVAGDDRHVERAGGRARRPEP